MADVEADVQEADDRRALDKTYHRLVTRWTQSAVRRAGDALKLLIDDYAATYGAEALAAWWATKTPKLGSPEGRRRFNRVSIFVSLAFGIVFLVLFAGFGVVIHRGMQGANNANPPTESISWPAVALAAVTTGAGALSVLVIAYARLVGTKGVAVAAQMKAEADVKRAEAELRRADAEVIRARKGLPPGVAPIGVGTTEAPAASSADPGTQAQP